MIVIALLLGAAISGGLYTKFEYEWDGPILGILAIAFVVCVVGLIIVGINWVIVPLAANSREQKIGECLKAFEYTRAQCEYFAKYGGPYK